MNFQSNFDLSAYNTFHVVVKCQYFTEIANEIELFEALKFAKDKNIATLILGGGSNLLFTKDLPYLCIANRIKGYDVIHENEAEVHVRFGAGESWHEIVSWAVKNQLGGIENLALIPGLMGAAPVQNIGAYGVELKDVLIAVNAIQLSTQQNLSFTNAQCEFGYRDSIFKKNYKGDLCITTVVLKLTKKNHKINSHYAALKVELDKKNIQNPSIKDIFETVSWVRESKLPDPKILGNAGSFFKNPEISLNQFEALSKEFHDMPHYPVDSLTVKIPAGWLIENCGWKGKRNGDAGMHEKQGLVLVNYGEATGDELISTAKLVIKDVLAKYGIELTPEVNIF